MDRYPFQTALGSSPARHDLVVVTDHLPLCSRQSSLTTQPPLTETLAAGLRPVLAAERGGWVGWSGATETTATPALTDHDGVRYLPVPLTSSDVEEYQQGHADSSLWPVYHDVIDRPVFHHRWQRAYRRVNRRYALAAATSASVGAMVWIHGHRLQLVPAMLRKLRPDLRIGLFLHTPFPPVELFARLPVRSDLLVGLLGADVIGLHRAGGARNLIRLCGQILGLPGDNDTVRIEERPVEVRPFRVGIDTAEVNRLVRLDTVRFRAAEIRHRLGNPRTVLLGLDELDTSQGTEQRLAAFGGLLRTGQLDSENTVLVQVVLPDAQPTPVRSALRERIEHQVGRINGDHARVGGLVLHYLHQPHSLADRVALYLAADVMTVTALREGTSLVAKEYVAARTDRTGTLVLSESTAAAADLSDAYLINPYDLEAVRSAILAAVRAPATQQAARLRSMRHTVYHHDIRAWTADFLARLSARATVPPADQRSHARC